MSDRRQRWRVVAGKLGSRWCCSWQVTAAMVLLGTIVSTGWGPTRGGLTLAEHVRVELVADAAGGVILAIAAVTVLRQRRQRTIPLLLVVAVWAAVGLARGLVLARFYLDGAVQIVSATLSLTAWALLLIYLAATFAEERDRADGLQEANVELRLIRGSTQELLEEERSRLIHAVQHSVSPEITRLRTLVTVLDRPANTAEITALADRVAAYSTGVIRETSRQLRNEDALPRPSAAVLDDVVSPPGVVQSYAGARQPIAVPMALVALKAVSIWASQGDAATALAGFLGLALVTGLAVLCRGVLERLVHRPSVVEVIAGTVLVVAVAAALTAMFQWARDGASGPAYTPLAMIFGFVLVVLVAARLVAGMELRWVNLTREWALVNADLEQVNRDLRDEVQVVRDQLAAILHGPVQGRLAAASMALRMYVDARESGGHPDLASTVMTTTILLDRAHADIERLGRPDQLRLESLDEGVLRIARNWSGLLTIDWILDDRWERPPAFVAGCLDLISELVTNASRHGDARHMSIAFRGEDGHRVRIEAIDDGSGPVDEVREGHGLAGVRRWQGEWDLTHAGGEGTRVTATLSHEISGSREISGSHEISGSREISKGQEVPSG